MTNAKTEKLVSRLTLAAFITQQAWQIGRDWMPHVKMWYLNRRSREIKVDSDCAFYYDVLVWMIEKGEGRKKTRSLEIVNGTRNSYEICPENSIPILLVPAISQPVKFRFHDCKVTVRRDSNQPPAGEKRALKKDAITIQVDTRDDKVMEALVDDIKAHAAKQRVRGISVRAFQWGSWRELCKVDMGERRALLPQGQYEELTADLEWFLSNHSWYKHRGIPYQRGYLFWGTAGNGKTTTAISLATSFGLDLCILNLGSRLMSDEALQEAIAGLPPRAALLLEDFDCAFTDRQVKGAGDLTFSGILNALDGAMSADGRVAFITTNHIDRIDKALLRPGRVDRRLEFQNPDHYQISELVKRFYPDSDFVNYPKFEGKSMAEIQELLVREAMSSVVGSSPTHTAGDMDVPSGMQTAPRFDSSTPALSHSSTPALCHT